jgi:drug/metabolite transporter (DMT)-like permease
MAGSSSVAAAGPETDVTLTGVGLAPAAVCQAATSSSRGRLRVGAGGRPRHSSSWRHAHLRTAALLTGGFATASDWVTEPVVWLAVLLAGSIGAAIPKVMVLMGVRRIGGTRTAMVMLAEPVVAVVAAAIVLGQPVTVTEVLGGSAILMAAALVQRPTLGDTRPLGGPEPAAAVASHE